jgi:SIT4-associating protein SAP155
MSFWPFSNPLHSNNQLHKFLDSIQDFSQVTADDLIGDPTLLQELISELHNIKGSYNNNNTSFQFLQQQGHDTNQTNNSSNSDTFSLTSSTNENNNTYNKDARGPRLLELLLQPQVMNGFLDYLINSVDFFHELSLKEKEELEKLIKEDDEDDEEKDAKRNGEIHPKVDEDNEVEIEQAEDMNTDRNSEDKESEEEETKEERLRRCIQVSSEILSIDLWVILNHIIETPAIINKLWLILKLPNLEENCLSVSYLVHILDQLMDKNSISLLNFIRRRTDLVDTFLNKIEIPMLMDFLLRVVQTDKASSPTGIVEVLSQQQLIPKLIEILKPHPSQFATKPLTIPNYELFFKQTAASDFIKALVTISSNTALAVVLENNIGPNQLTRELVSPDIIKTMINDIMLFNIPSETGSIQSNKHGINNCVGIIIELIRKNNSDYDLNCGTYSSMLQNCGDENAGSEVNSYVMFHWLKDFEQNPPGLRDPIYLGEMLSIFSGHLDKFAELMKRPSDAPLHVNDSHVLGFTKFKISELIAELLHCSNMILLNSRKIRKIVKIRDTLRLQQSDRLKKALAETFVNKHTDQNSHSINDVTNGLDDVSLDDINFIDGDKRDESKIDIPDDSKHIFFDETNDYSNLIESLEAEDDSDDDEPKISTQNPFVCSDREKSIRMNPCIGDEFKIKLSELEILFDIVSKFTVYPWHNFFHNVVFDLIQQIFNGKLNSYNSFLIVDLFKLDKCNLTDLIVRSYRESHEPRPGYMGHLILISEEVVKFTSLYKPDLISPIILDAILSKDWDWFVNEILLKTREVYNVVLGSEQDEEDEGHRLNDKDQDSFGFDSSTVGYLDLDSYDKEQGSSNKNLIILGDRSNHDLFVNDRQHASRESNEDYHEDDDEDDDDDENMEETPVPDVRLEGSPLVEDLHNLDFYDNEHFHDEYQENEFIDDLSGSSSSDEEDDADEEGDEGDSREEDGNELRRVSRHNE